MRSRNPARARRAELAARSQEELGTELSAYVATELARMAARPTNEQIVARLRLRDRSDGPTPDDIVAAVRADRR